MEKFFVDILLPAGMILVYVTAGLAILSALVGSANDPKAALKSLIGFGLVAVLMFVAFSLASPENPSNNEVTGNIAKWVEGGILAVLIMVVTTFVLMLGSMVKDIFN